MTSAGGAVGIIANPSAGKDLRRLVSAASPISDVTKIGIIRRAAIGAVEGGASRVVLAADTHALTRRAVDGADLPTEVIDLELMDSGRDTQRAAERMAELDVGAVVVLGGDGTNRDVVKGWRQASLVSLSTGTNNVFPRSREATTAGQAAGVVASGAVDIDDAADTAAIIDVDIVGPDGEIVAQDLGLVDVALTDGRFTGSRAVWDADTLRELVAVIAEPDAVGLSAIAAAVAPTDRREQKGVRVRMNRGDERATTVRCAIAPGAFTDVQVTDVDILEPGDEVEMAGPGVLSFDGERDVVLTADQTAIARIGVDGPRVIDVARALARRPHKRSSAWPTSS